MQEKDAACLKCAPRYIEQNDFISDDYLSGDQPLRATEKTRGGADVSLEAMPALITTDAMDHAGTKLWRGIGILVVLIWLGVCAIGGAKEWGGENVSSRENLLFNEKPWAWHEQHPECRERYRTWPDGTWMSDSDVDEIAAHLRWYSTYVQNKVELITPEDRAREEWANRVRQRIADCEEAQWMPLAKEHAIYKLRIEIVTFSILPPIFLFLIFYGSSWTWRRFGSTTWTTIPANVRRGVLRLYLAVIGPWIVWFAYRISWDENHYERYVQNDVLALFSLPLGAVALFLIGGWIVEGFRTQTPIPTVADYHSVLTRAIYKLENSSPLARQDVYRRARAALISELAADPRAKPRTSQHVRRLESAIQLVESQSNRELERKASTALLVITIMFPILWASDFTSMSVYWVARLPRDAA